jgi:hypothetical protein
MISVPAVLAIARSKGVRFWLEAGQLRYNAPKGSLTADQLAEFRSRRNDIIEFLLQAARPMRPPLTPMPRPKEIPLSFAQQRIWFQQQLDPHAAVYNVPIVLRLQGPIDRCAMQLAIGDVVARHESLRTVFPTAGGVPKQVILDANRARPAFDVSPISAEDVAAALEHAATHDFDLATEIPLRTWLWRLDEDLHVLLLLLHHIVTDGWSIACLFRDVTTAYAARYSGRMPEWSPLPAQYADYTLWQRALLAQEDSPGSLISGQIAYWRKTLADLPEQLPLPTDRPRPPIPSHRGETVFFAIGSALHAPLKAFASSRSASLFMVLQAGVSMLLNRLGAGDDIPLGAPVAGRTDSALDSMVGMFVNTIVLRNNLSGNPSFNELLSRVRATTLAAYDNQDLPFDRLVQILRPARSAARHPLFQVRLQLLNLAPSEFNIPGVKVVAEPLTINTSKFDLLVSFHERHDPNCQAPGIDGSIEYASDLFTRGSIQSMCKHLARILQVVVHDPTQTIGQLSLSGEPRTAPVEILEGYSCRKMRSFPRQSSAINAAGIRDAVDGSVDDGFLELVDTLRWQQGLS